MIKYKLTACGGTFDMFHAGHKAFIEQVLNQSEKVVLGITSDLYVKSFKDGNTIESFEFRKSAVEKFLDSIGAKDRVQIMPIDDIYGPLLTNVFNFQAVAVTSQTENMTTDINQKRKEKNLPELEVILLPLKTAEDGEIISATRIRNGEINRDGRLYLNPKWKNKTLVLPENLRSTLQHPWGKVMNEVPEEIKGAKAVAIGDITVQKFNQKNVAQFLSIVDFLVQRQIRFHELSELGLSEQNVQKAKNPHGTITPELFLAIEKAFKTTDKKIILVEGEEDLAVLPVLLIAPLGFSVFYGQPNQGLVQVNVAEENKEKAYQLVESFDKSEEV
jgi:cytidyltransferase-like protein